MTPPNGIQELNGQGKKVDDILNDLYTNQFNNVNGKYIKYRAAKLNPSRNCKVAFIGDSTFAGITTPSTTSQVIQSIPMQLAKMLNQCGIPAGASNRFGCGSNLMSVLTSIDGRVTSNGAWSQTGSTVAGGNAFGLNSANSGSMIFTPQANCTKFDVYWYNSGTSGRAITYLVDSSGANGTITTTGAANISKTTINAGTLSSHSLTLSYSAGANFTVLGIDAYDDSNSRREISMYNWGISGATSIQLSQDNDPVLGRLTTYKYFAPDLSIIEGGIINDWRQSVPLDTTKNNLTTLVTTMKQYGDVILYAPRFDAAISNNALIQDQYVRVMYDVASKQNVDVFDIRSSFGSYALANSAGFYGDDVHGDQYGIGYGDEANQLLKNFFLKI